MLLFPKELRGFLPVKLAGGRREQGAQNRPDRSSQSLITHFDLGMLTVRNPNNVSKLGVA